MVRPSAPGCQSVSRFAFRRFPVGHRGCVPDRPGGWIAGRCDPCRHGSCSGFRVLGSRHKRRGWPDRHALWRHHPTRREATSAPGNRPECGLTTPRQPGQRAVAPPAMGVPVTAASRIGGPRPGGQVADRWRTGADGKASGLKLLIPLTEGRLGRDGRQIRRIFLIRSPAASRSGTARSAVTGRHRLPERPQVLRLTGPQRLLRRGLSGVTSTLLRGPASASTRRLPITSDAWRNGSSARCA